MTDGVAADGQAEEADQETEERPQVVTRFTARRVAIRPQRPENGQDDEKRQITPLLEQPVARFFQVFTQCHFASLVGFKPKDGPDARPVKPSQPRLDWTDSPGHTSIPGDFDRR